MRQCQYQTPGTRKEELHYTPGIGVYSAGAWARSYNRPSHKSLDWSNYSVGCTFAPRSGFMVISDVARQQKQAWLQQPPAPAQWLPFTAPPLTLTGERRALRLLGCSDVIVQGLSDVEQRPRDRDGETERETDRESERESTHRGLLRKQAYSGKSWLVILKY